MVVIYSTQAVACRFPLEALYRTLLCYAWLAATLCGLAAVFLRALAIDDAWPMFGVLLLGHPHVMERPQ